MYRIASSAYISTPHLFEVSSFELVLYLQMLQSVPSGIGCMLRSKTVQIDCLLRNDWTKFCLLRFKHRRPVPSFSIRKANKILVTYGHTAIPFIIVSFECFTYSSVLHLANLHIYCHIVHFFFHILHIDLRFYTFFFFSYFTAKRHLKNGRSTSSVNTPCTDQFLELQKSIKSFIQDTLQKSAKTAKQTSVNRGVLNLEEFRT